MTVARLLWTEWSWRRESNGSAALNKVRAYRKIRVHFKGEKPAFKYRGGQHEKFSEVAAGARGDSDGRRWFKRTRVRARQRRSKYSGLAGLSAASPGIEAAIVTTRRATVLHSSTQVATSASTLTWPVRIALSCRIGVSATPQVSSWCHRHFPAHVYERLNRLCHSKRRRCSSARRQAELPSV
jgi:hypothetical protein